MKNRTKIILTTGVVIIAVLSIRNCSCNNQKSIVNTDTTSNSYLQTKSLISKLEFNSIFFIDP